ncbi:acetoacetate--CoA ligase [Saccharospirillum alexandrii]|uniref:acetoacetate--CoA ligase n=1 Tax=Saccharospirillum alexandrii TaxID=2448477 RepID=UPI003736D389
MTVLFTPSAEQKAKSQMGVFADLLKRKYPIELEDYQALQQWSVQNLTTFWRELWAFANVQGNPGETVLEQSTMPGARWFPEARLNFSTNLLHVGRDADTALIALSETRPEHRYSYADLRQAVAGLAGFLQHECGVEPGDRVAAYLGNTPEAIIGMLAASRIGAVWTSASPDFGYEGVLDRFGQVEPKVVIAGNGYGYGGKAIERTGVVKSLQAALPTVRQWVQVDTLPSADVIDGAWKWEDVVSRDWPEAPPRELAFDHPLYILYSSGTTGKPKCIVHGAGGTLLQHAKELRLHGDISQDSVFFYFTTTGWMMWNWLASGLMTGASLVLFDGNPMYPRSDVLWQLADKLGITHFGTSAKYLSACRKQDLEPGKTFDLSALSTVFSTGSPLAPEDYDWVYSALKPDVMLQSISGGTDIVSCFVGGNPWSPVVRGKIQGPNLGMDVQAWNEAGEKVVNQRGELVCAQPAPCMPIGFWNDPGDERYRAAYFERFDGVWAQGDFIEFDDAGQAVIHGRSDTTLNPGGVRIGTAEIYRQVETLTEIADSLVVGQAVDGDVKVILFVQLPEGQQLDKALIGRIRQRIRENTTPRHVPADIVQVPAIPYTRSGKKVELAVTQILRGEEPANLTALANPESLQAYRDYYAG